MPALTLAALAGVDPATNELSTWQQFGAFAICFVLMSGVIAWLLRERTKALATIATDRAAERAANIAAMDKVTAANIAAMDKIAAAHVEAVRELSAERDANRGLYERIAEQGKQMAVVLEMATRALEKVASGASR